MISIVVPTKNEGPEAAEKFRRMAQGPDAELLVADGGGECETVRAFEAIGGRIFRSEGTRGGRLAAAARQARGDILFFLHADSRPPEGALALVRRALQNGASSGAFSLAYEDATPSLRWIAWWANVRSRLLHLPFGDQGLFCAREAYERSGGFRDLPICDDVDLVRRLKRLGGFVVLPEKTVTSPRRYLRRGAFSQVLRNWRVLVGYYAGVSPATLERWYNR
jgi:rSAM/selenodomain-associated transferase 2